MQKISKNYFSILNEQIWVKISKNSQKSRQNLKNIDLSDFILLPTAKKMETRSKVSFIKVVGAAFLIKSIIF